MKFKYIGDLPIKSMDLTRAGIFPPREVIYTGTIFEIPDSNKILIKKIMLDGAFEEYIEPKRKIIKKDKEEE